MLYVVQWEDPTTKDDDGEIVDSLAGALSLIFENGDCRKFQVHQIESARTAEQLTDVDEYNEVLTRCQDEPLPDDMRQIDYACWDADKAGTWFPDYDDLKNL